MKTQAAQAEIILLHMEKIIVPKLEARHLHFTGVGTCSCFFARAGLSYFTPKAASAFAVGAAAAPLAGGLTDSKSKETLPSQASMKPQVSEARDLVETQASTATVVQETPKKPQVRFHRQASTPTDAQKPTDNSSL